MYHMYHTWYHHFTSTRSSCWIQSRQSEKVTEPDFTTLTHFKFYLCFPPHPKSHCSQDTEILHCENLHWRVRLIIVLLLIITFFHPQPKQIRVSVKTGIPLDVLPARGPTAKQAERMARINDSDLPRVSTQPRDKDESKEDRRERKLAIKEERKVRNKEGGRCPGGYKPSHHSNINCKLRAELKQIIAHQYTHSHQTTLLSNKV